MIVQVECAPAPPGGESMPHWLSLGERRVELVEILDWWPGADHRYVKARGENGATYILRQDLPRGQWELILFQAPAP